MSIEKQLQIAQDFIGTLIEHCNNLEVVNAAIKCEEEMNSVGVGYAMNGKRE